MGNSRSAIISPTFFPKPEERGMNKIYKYLSTFDGFTMSEAENEESKGVRVTLPSGWTLFEDPSNIFNYRYYIVDNQRKIVALLEELDQDKYHDYHRCGYLYKKKFKIDQHNKFTYPFPEFYIEKEGYLVIDPESTPGHLLKSLEWCDGYYKCYVNETDADMDRSQFLEGHTKMTSLMKKYPKWDNYEEFSKYNRNYSGYGSPSIVFWKVPPYWV